MTIEYRVGIVSLRHLPPILFSFHSLVSFFFPTFPALHLLFSLFYHSFLGFKCGSLAGARRQIGGIKIEMVEGRRVVGFELNLGDRWIKTISIFYLLFHAFLLLAVRWLVKSSEVK